MQVDPSAAERFLSYLDGETTRSDVWDHPGYRVVREHARVLGRDLIPEDLSAAVDGEDTAFGDLSGVRERRPRIERLLGLAGSREPEWTACVERQLDRLVPGADTDDVTVHLGVGYSIGVGLAGGAYLDASEPLFHRAPRELLYAAVHEASHVVYEREHNAVGDGTRPADVGRRRDRLEHGGPHRGARDVRAARPPAIRRERRGGDHPLREDYAALSDDERLETLVAEYDAFRDRVREGPVPRDDLFERLFGGSRLPYRVGCALLDAVERTEGLDGVREAFHADPVEFPERYDWALDRYRT